jgi:hypothetical protein
MRRFATTALFLATLIAPGLLPGQIKARQVRQQQRVGQGIRSGQLTPREATRLERQETRLNREIRRDRIDGGGMSAQERRKINRQQNRLSRRIYTQKHDAQQFPR